MKRREWEIEVRWECCCACLPADDRSLHAIDQSCLNLILLISYLWVYRTGLESGRGDAFSYLCSSPVYLELLHNLNAIHLKLYWPFPFSLREGILGLLWALDLYSDCLRKNGSALTLSMLRKERKRDANRFSVSNTLGHASGELRSHPHSHRPPKIHSIQDLTSSHIAAIR